MSRISGSEAQKLMQAYHAIYEGSGEKKEKEGKKKVMHNCATHGEHAEWGVGSMIQEMHTLDEEGNITHYDVMFEHGIEKNVPVGDLTILEGKMHEHFINDEKNAEVLDEDLIGDVLANRGKIKSAANRAVTATNRAASSTNKALGTAVSDTARQAQTGVRQTAKDVAKGYQYGGATGAAAALGANIVRGIASSGQRPAKPSPTFQNTGGDGRYAPPSTQVRTPAPTRTPTVTTPSRTPTATTPSRTPAAPAAAKPAPSAPAAPAAKPATPARTFNPLMQKTFGYQTGNAPDQIAKASAGAPPTPSGSALGAAAKPEVRKALNLPAKASTAPEVKQTAEIAKKTTQPTVAPTPTQMRQGTFREEVDAYDLVLEYLLTNGHADTVDEAHYVMLEMDSEMIQSIVEEEGKEEPQKPFTGEGPKKPKGWKPTGPKLKSGQRPGYAR